MEGVPGVSDRIRDAMTALGLSQRDLATRSGVSQPTLQRSLTGNREFRVDELLDVAAALDVPLATLVDDPTDQGFLFAARTSSEGVETAKEAVRRRLETLLRIRTRLDEPQ